MNRLDRLTSILIQLQSKKIVRAKEIAERFEISLRTVYRDIRSLEEAGVPIGGEVGVGYFLVDGYNLPPIHFTQQEAGALLFGEKLVEHFTDKSLDQQYGNALLKVKAVLRGREKEYVERLEQSVYIPDTFETKNKVSKYLEPVNEAIVAQLKLKIVYQSVTESISEREVAPIGIVFYGNQWHLIAYCFKRNDYRDFRTDRIRSLETLNEDYNRESYQSVQSYLKRDQEERETTFVTLKLSWEVVAYWGSLKYFFGLISEQKKKEGIVMEFMTSDLEYMARTILSSCKEIDVIEGDQLLQLLKKYSKEVFEKWV